MNWNDLLAALALVMIVEGIVPFMAPKSYKDTLQQLISMPDKFLRTVGLVLMLIGVISLYWVRQ